jgi:hypothetical protein
MVAFFVIGTIGQRGITAMQTMHNPESYSAADNLLRAIYSSMRSFTYVAVVAYMLLNLIMIFRRFYTNLFTDQGYLTFTLPVSRTGVMASKFLMGYIYVTACVIIVILGTVVMRIFNTAEGLVDVELLQRWSTGLQEFWTDVGWVGLVYIAELLLMALAAEACVLLLYYSCITIGSVLVKKHKIMAAIGIYYGGNMAITIAFVIAIVVFVDSSFVSRVGDIPEAWQFQFINAMFALIIAAIALVAWLLFFFNVRLLHKKLNLA